MASSLAVKIAGVNQTDVLQASVDFKLINQGHSVAVVLIDNYDGSHNNTFLAHDEIEIKVENLTVFKGYIDTAKNVVSPEMWQGRKILRVSARDYSEEFSRLRIINEYCTGLKVDDLIDDMMDYAGLDNCGCSNVTFASGSVGPALKEFTAEGYLINPIRDALERGSPVMEGFVGTNKALQLWIPANIPNTGITISNSNTITKNYIEQDSFEVRNSILIKGALLETLKHPTDADWYTEDASGASGTYWYTDYGTTSRVNADPQVGSWHIENDAEDLGGGSFRSEFGIDTLKSPFFMPIKVKDGEFGTLHFWYGFPEATGMDAAEIYLICSDGSYFYGNLTQSSGWHGFGEALGPVNTYDATLNPDGFWIKQPAGCPSWWDIVKIEFYAHWVNPVLNAVFYVDGLYLDPVRYRSTLTQDAGVGSSIAKYGQRDWEEIDDQLFSNDECQEVADRKLALLKLPTQLLNFTCPVSTFIVGAAWKAYCGHKITVDYSDLGITAEEENNEWRIININLNIVPYRNLMNGHDAILTIDALPISNFYDRKQIEQTRQPNLISTIPIIEMKWKDKRLTP